MKLSTVLRNKGILRMYNKRYQKIAINFLIDLFSRLAFSKIIIFLI